MLVGRKVSAHGRPEHAEAGVRTDHPADQQGHA
jgi:hypothetical protein